MPLRLVGTRSCAIRHRMSEEGEHLVKLMGKSLSSDSARARSQKQQKEASRRYSAGRAGAHPSGAGEVARSYHSYDSTLTRNKRLRVGSFLERFFDRSEERSTKCPPNHCCSPDECRHHHDE